MFHFYYFLFFGLSFVQVKQDKVWDADGVKTVVINCSWVSQIDVSTHEISTIRVKYIQEGEYQNAYLLSSKREGNSFYIEEKQRTSFNDPNDKLSAHKVVANKMQLILPENLNIKLNAKETVLKLSGNFEILNIVFNQGKAFFNVPQIKGDIMTLGGDIYLHNIKSNKIPETLNVINKHGNIIINPKNNLFLP